MAFLLRQTRYGQDYPGIWWNAQPGPHGLAIWPDRIEANAVADDAQLLGRDTGLEKGRAGALRHDEKAISGWHQLTEGYTLAVPGEQVGQMLRTEHYRHTGRAGSVDGVMALPANPGMAVKNVYPLRTQPMLQAVLCFTLVVRPQGENLQARPTRALEQRAPRRAGRAHERDTISPVELACEGEHMLAHS